jgi:hypothetical protein
MRSVDGFDRAAKTATLVRSVKSSGFKLEGVHIKGLDGRQDAISYGMLRSQCRWLKENRNGQKLTNAANPS